MTSEEMISRTRQVLLDIGFNGERANDRSAMVLLALAGIHGGMQWAKATDKRYTTREIMDWIRDHFGIDYKPNTRETIRRFTLHQFCAGGAVLHNDDDPERPINSPKNCYRLTPMVLAVVRAIDSSRYDRAVNRFVNNVETWREQQAETRKIHRVPVSMPDGRTISLSPGGQNLLMRQIVEEFCPRFTPGGSVLYIDDTDHALGTVLPDMAMGLPLKMPEHGKAPDLIVLDREHNWLFLMEACSTHGPIDVTRKRELLELFSDAGHGLVLVSCFPGRDIMRKYLSELAWETEAWCADSPDHLIHLDGKRFLGPY